MFVQLCRNALQAGPERKLRFGVTGMGLQGDRWAGGPGKASASAAQEVPVLPAWGALTGEMEGVKCTTSMAKDTVQGELLTQGCTI